VFVEHFAKKILSQTESCGCPLKREEDKVEITTSAEMKNVEDLHNVFVILSTSARQRKVLRLTVSRIELLVKENSPDRNRPVGYFLLES